MSHILPSLKSKEYYSNVLLIAPDGTKLATVGHDRAEWYLSRNLATEITPESPYARVIQLKFEPKGKPQSDRGLHTKETKCVVCGATEHLTLHHVVPRLIRRNFPTEDATRQHLWCLLLCEEHHLQVEALYAPYLTKSARFKALQKETRAPHSPNYRLRALKALHNLTKQGILSRLEQSHPERIQILLTEAGLKKLPSLEELESLAAPTPAAKDSTLSRTFADEFIREHGGVEKVKELFRNLFLQMKPKYLPKNAMTDIY